MDEDVRQFWGIANKNAILVEDGIFASVLRDARRSGAHGVGFVSGRRMKRA